MKYYKVVKQYYPDGPLMSAIMQEPEVAVEYALGEWASALEYLARRGYHLLVFADLRAAEIFLSLRYGCVLYECEVQDVLETIPYPRWIPEWPTGTVMVKQVKLIRRVI